MGFVVCDEIRYPRQERFAPGAGRWAHTRLAAPEVGEAHHSSCGSTLVKDEPIYDSSLVYEAERGFFRFARGPKKGRFVLSREYAHREDLREIGYFEGWGHRLRNAGAPGTGKNTPSGRRQAGVQGLT